MSPARRIAAVGCHGLTPQMLGVHIPAVGLPLPDGFVCVLPHGGSGFEPLVAHHVA